MFKLFLRNYFLFVLVLTTIIILLITFVNSQQQAAEDNTASMAFLGPIHFLEQKLKTLPEHNWQKYIDTLQAESPQKIMILSKEELPKELQNATELEQGKIIGDLPGFQILKPRLYSSSMGYARIGNSDKYLSISLTPPIIKTYQSNSAWIKIVLDQLFAPGNNIETARKQAEAIFNNTVTLKPASTLTAKEKKYYADFSMMAEAYDGDHIAILSYLTPDGKYSITLGALSDSIVVRYINVILIILILSILLIITFIWSYPFYRSLNKLQKQAIDYGNGKFDTKLKVSKTLALNPLNKGLHKMADQIQTLIASHKELTNAVAHEIKTPLARVRFTLSVLKQKYKTIDQKYINDLDDDIAILDNLVNEILLHAKFDRKGVALNKKEENLNQLLQDKTKWFAHKYPDKHWTFKNSPIEINLAIDKINFNRALDNLLNNAYQYGGDQITMSLGYQDNTIIISIEDNGKGICDEDKDKIFEPFERLSESRNKGVQGHGLGLAITKKIIESHHGNISVETTENNQTVFTIKFPKPYQKLGRNG